MDLPKDTFGVTEDEVALDLKQDIEEVKADISADLLKRAME